MLIGLDLVHREKCEKHLTPAIYIYIWCHLCVSWRGRDFRTNIHNKLSLITKKKYTYNIAYTNTPHADGYNLKLEYKEFDCKIQ